VLRDTALGLGGATALAAALVLLWPYYPVLELWQEASKVAPDHAALYQGVLLRSFLLLPGTAALVLRARRSRRDPLVWMFLGALTVYTVGFLTAHYGLGRIMPLIALSSHVALAGMVAGWVASGNRHRTAAAVATIVLIGEIGLLGSMPALVRMVPTAVLVALAGEDSPLSPAVEPYASLGQILDPPDVVISTDRMSKIVPAVKGRVLVPGYQTLLLTDRDARDRASSAFFSDDTSAAERDAIAARWSLTRIIVEPTDLIRYPWLASSYDVVAETEFYVVFAIG
jgi:alpha-1,6-mannosyltransferase